MVGGGGGGGKSVCVGGMGMERNFAWGDAWMMQCADDVLSCIFKTCTPVNSIKSSSPK